MSRPRTASAHEIQPRLPPTEVQPRASAHEVQPRLPPHEIGAAGLPTAGFFLFYGYDPVTGEPNFLTYEPTAGGRDHLTYKSDP